MSHCSPSNFCATYSNKSIDCFWYRSQYFWSGTVLTGPSSVWYVAQSECSPTDPFASPGSGWKINFIYYIYSFLRVTNAQIIFLLFQIKSYDLGSITLILDHPLKDQVFVTFNDRSFPFVLIEWRNGPFMFLNPDWIQMMAQKELHSRMFLLLFMHWLAMKKVFQR